MSKRKLFCLTISLILFFSGCAPNIPTGLNIESVNQPNLANAKIALLGGIFLDTKRELLEDVPLYLSMIPEPIVPALNSHFSNSLSTSILEKNNNLSILTFDSVYSILSNESTLLKANELLSNIILSSITDKVVKIPHGSKIKTSNRQIHLNIRNIPISKFSELCDMLEVDAIAFTILSNTLNQYTSGGLVSSTNYSVYTVGTTQVIQYKDDVLFSIWDGSTDHSSSTGSAMGLLGIQGFNKEREELIKHYNFRLVQTQIAKNMAESFCQLTNNQYNDYAISQRFTPFIMPKTDSDKIYINWFNKEKVTAVLHIFQADGIKEVKSFENNKKIIHSFEIENVWELVGSDKFTFKIEAGDGFSTLLYHIDKPSE